MEEKKVLEFFAAAMAVAKERGKLYEFVCPICGRIAQTTKSEINGHLNAHCAICDIHIMQ